MPARSRRYNQDDPFPQRLAGALLISVLAHTSFFGIVQIGNQLQWWDARPFSMFRKARVTPEELAQLQEQQQSTQDPPSILVQVTHPTDETPDETQYYSSVSSRAANPEPGDRPDPQLEGTQTQVARTEAAPRIPTGESSPPPQPEPTPARAETPTTAPPDTTPAPAPELAAAPAPAPTPAPSIESIVPGELPTLVDRASEPERQPGIGDLALVEVKPVPLPPPPAPPVEPTREIERPVTPAETAATTPTPPQQPSATVPRIRPRTVAEAKLRQELLAGEAMKQEGGVAKKGPVQLEVQGKSFGAYDLILVNAVQNRWFALLDEKRFAGGARGRVVVNFKLYSDGSVRIIEPGESSVDFLHQALCVRAVRDPAPFEPWPPAMLREVGRPYREVRFTFFYN